MVMLRSDPGNFDVGPSLLCVNFGDGRVAALIWIMPFWPPYEVEAARGQGEPWFVGHLVFVDVNLQALREVPVEVAQSGSNAGSG